MTINRLSLATGFPPEALQHFAQKGMLVPMRADSPQKLYDGLSLVTSLEEVLYSE